MLLSTTVMLLAGFRMRLMTRYCSAQLLCFHVVVFWGAPPADPKYQNSRLSAYQMILFVYEILYESGRPSCIVRFA